MIVGAWRDAGGVYPAFVRVLSGKKLSLTTKTNVLSVSTGGAYSFELDAGVANQLKTYLLLGSLTGTAPGVSLGKVTVPVNFDPYFVLNLTYPNTLITNSLGVLEWYGKSTATLNLPKGLPASTIGTVLYHAFAAADLRNPPYEIDFASNPVLMRIEQ